MTDGGLDIAIFIARAKARKDCAEFELTFCTLVVLLKSTSQDAKVRGELVC